MVCEAVEENTPPIFTEGLYSASCQLRVVSCELSVASCQLRVVSCELSVASCQLRVVSCELSVASCQLQVGFHSYFVSCEL